MCLSGCNAESNYIKQGHTQEVIYDLGEGIYTANNRNTHTLSLFYKPGSYITDFSSVKDYEFYRESDEAGLTYELGGWYFDEEFTNPVDFNSYTLPEESGAAITIYAKWDEDGVHFDKTLGREVRHQKGEWKTDDNGQYYTETVGANQTYGKEFVAYSDILSKEDSWANNIDFFDSDDKKKSVAGTIVKTAAGILPYLFPGFREVWGGITAAVALSSVLPTFAKMAEGVVIGDKETGFTKAMNSIENYFNKFDESHSDAGKSSIINFETIMGTIGDVYGQLYQMRAAASLSNLYTKQFTKAQEKSYKAFADKFRIEWAKAHAANPKEFSKNPNAFKELWQSLADSTPEMKDLIKK